jgi:hypothetical protein
VRYEACLLTQIRVLTPREETVGDLCRVRAHLVGDLTQAKNWLFAFYCVMGERGAAETGDP